MLILLALGMLVSGAAAPTPQSGKSPGPAAKASLTGCVDEHDGQYVLTNEKTLEPTARLQPAAGSPEDNFARHLGHKVTVRGKLSKEEPIPVMTVESLETVSQTCAPAGEHQSQ